MKKTAALTMILFVISLLFACTNGKDASGIETTTNGDTTGTDMVQTIAEPENNFDGYEFRILLNGPLFGYYRAREFSADNWNGEPINDAVYRRNTTVEAKYNFKIKVFDETSWTNMVDTMALKSINAGEDAYDMIMPFINSTPILAEKNMLIDLHNVSAFMFDQPWWDQRANEQLSIGGKLFFTTGDISILDNFCTFGVLFNKTLINDYNLSNPYNLVKSGDWTIDTMYEMAKKTVNDLNGDGLYDHEDQWGVLSECNAANGMFFSAGEHIVTHDEDGLLKLSIYSERTVAIMEKVFSFLEDTDVVINAEELKSDNIWALATKMFANNQVLFRTCALVSAEELNAIDINFGIIPYPKYEKAQKEYNNFVSTVCVPGVCIPSTVGDPERAGSIIEALARGAATTITPAYYDHTLYGRIIRDDESYDMLNLIFATRTYDLGQIYNWGGMGLLLKEMNSRKESNFASQYEAIAIKAQTELDKTMEIYKNIK